MNTAYNEHVSRYSFLWCPDISVGVLPAFVYMLCVLEYGILMTERMNKPVLVTSESSVRSED